MKFHVTILLALLSVCVVCSCSKSSDHANEGTLLKRYTSTYSDTVISYYIYDRDANNRVIAMRDSTNTFEYKTNLLYGSNGKLEKVIFNLGTNGSYSYEFTYNSDGRISKRKTRAGTLPIGENYNVYVYDAAGHLTVDSLYSTVNNTTFNLHMVSRFQYTGENITEAENYIASNGTLELNDRLKFDYDNETNPFSDLEYEYYINESGSAIFTIPLKSRNNALKMSVSDGNGGWDLQQNATYLYNSNRYAWKASKRNVTVTQPPIFYEYFFL